MKTSAPNCQIPQLPKTLLLLLVAVQTSLFLAGPAMASRCSATAWASHRACKAEVNDDYWLAVGNCLNIPEENEVLDCWDEAKADRRQAREECTEQREARFDLCDEVGEEAYDPDFEPSGFVTEFTNQNPYFPLAPGNSWTYEEGDETIQVDVLDQTKLIEGVTCIVVRDLVSEDGLFIEDTDDWYAVRTNGEVLYTGEVSQNFEFFAGDDPEVAELVDLEGSWKTGRDGAKPGVQMFANPVVGTVYRQEIALGDAEDAAEVLSTTYSFGDDPELDLGVPEALADLLCDGDCLVILEFTPLDPDVAERKYYAPGVGFFFGINLEDGETAQITACNVAPACDDLPAD